MHHSNLFLRVSLRECLHSEDEYEDSDSSRDMANTCLYMTRVGNTEHEVMHLKRAQKFKR